MVSSSQTSSSGSTCTRCRAPIPGHPYRASINTPNERLYCKACSQRYSAIQLVLIEAREIVRESLRGAL